MFDNFNLIPGEAFGAIDNISNNLINKIADATGYILTPHGKRKDEEEAINYFIEEIKKNDKMPLYLKMASISEARRLLKRYRNQQDIFLESMKYLNDNATPELIDDDWLVNFTEKAGSISNKDVQAIYAKMLSEESIKPGTASKNLINIIAVMDNESANAFRELIKCMIFLEDDNGEEEPSVIYPINHKEEYNKNLRFTDFVNLSSLGLLEYSAGLSGGYAWENTELKARYGDKHFILKSNKGISIMSGNVNLTRSGKELAKILTPEIEYEYLDRMKDFWKKRNVDIIEK